MNKNIVLVGFMGSGKTSVGIKLAKVLSYQFLDTDAMIVEKSGLSITEIFDQQGEEAFRQMETDLLKELNENLAGAIISTGGGMPMREENRELLKALGHVIFLYTTPEITLERVEDDTKRPLLDCENPKEKIMNLLETRLPFYKACANQMIDTSNKSFYEIITEVENAIKE